MASESCVLWSRGVAVKIDNETLRKVLIEHNLMTENDAKGLVTGSFGKLKMSKYRCGVSSLTVATFNTK